MSHTEIVVEPTTRSQLEAVELATPIAGPARRAVTRSWLACQRGMVTAEYAVGILAAIAMAMVLYHVLTGGKVEPLILQQLTQLIGRIGSQIK